MLIRHTFFHCELFSWYIFLAECEILNLVDVGIFSRTAHCVDDHLLTISRVNIILFKSFIPSIFNCLSIVQKHLAQTCGSITFADLQTFYQTPVFNSKTHNLQMRKYDVSMTSLAANNI